MASYDVASNICLALVQGADAAQGYGPHWSSSSIAQTAFEGWAAAAMVRQEGTGTAVDGVSSSERDKRAAAAAALAATVAADAAAALDASFGTWSSPGVSGIGGKA
jgi:hypothetical protein